MATTGTIKGGLFQKRLERENIKTIVPKDVEQSEIMESVYDIKNAKRLRPMSEITMKLAAIAKSLVS